MEVYKAIRFEDVMSALTTKRRKAIEAKGRETSEKLDRRAIHAEMRKSRRIRKAKRRCSENQTNADVAPGRRKEPLLSTLRGTKYQF